MNLSSPLSIGSADPTVHPIVSPELLNNTMSLEDNEELSKAIATYQRVEHSLAWASQYPKKRCKDLVLLNSIKPRLEQAIFGVNHNPSTVTHVRRLRRNAEFIIRELHLPVIGRVINGFKYVLYESTVPVKVLFGLLMALPLYLTLPALPYQAYIVNPILGPVIKGTKDCAQIRSDRAQATNAQRASLRSAQFTFLTRCDVDQSIAYLVLVGIAGALGSIVSILTRIKEYETEKYTDTILPVCIGAFKPLIGGTFGILIFTLIHSSVLPFKFEASNRQVDQWYALYAIAFVAGFSERLVKDIISQTEDKFTGKKDIPNLSTHQLNEMKDLIERLNTQMQTLTVQTPPQPTATPNGNQPQSTLSQPAIPLTRSEAEPDNQNGESGIGA